MLSLSRILLSLMIFSYFLNYYLWINLWVNIHQKCPKYKESYDFSFCNDNQEFQATFILSFLPKLNNSLNFLKLLLFEKSEICFIFVVLSSYHGHTFNLFTRLQVVFFQLKMHKVVYDFLILYTWYCCNHLQFVSKRA